MQMPTGVLVIGIVQMLLLVASVNATVFVHNRYKVRYTAISAFVPLAQVANLTFLLQHLTGHGILGQAESWSGRLLIAAQILLMLLLFMRLVWLLRTVPVRRRNILTQQSIRETIDYLPGGISFCAPNGNPVLTNHKMNRLVYQLIGHTVLNTLAAWDELSQTDSKNGCSKLEKTWMNRENRDGFENDTMYFLLPDDSIWRFRKEALTDRTPHYIQLEATDITDLYRYSKELFDNNEMLREQHKRQQSLLANIVQINHEREILAAKMSVHADLGRSILTTRQHLNNETLIENIPHIAEMWYNTIRNMGDFTHIIEDADISPEAELLKAAQMVGCRIDFRGDRPTDRKTALLFYALVREALTNAVLHAKADLLIVAIEPTDHGYHVEISDNGTVLAPFVTEGSGLGNLRKRLEQDGATLHIKCDGGVVLTAHIP